MKLKLTIQATENLLEEGVEYFGISLVGVVKKSEFMQILEKANKHSFNVEVLNGEEEN